MKWDDAGESFSEVFEFKNLCLLEPKKALVLVMNTSARDSSSFYSCIQ
ncbi:MAG TPA: hypothetical protein PL110_02280 [Candidatus Eremiobacteraeota bacterium]|nr:hypothetical protein [Candidatus Eremiobacteraeota bacterium]